MALKMSAEITKKDSLLDKLFAMATAHPQTPSCAAPSDGSLPPDSCRARRMLLTAELGQQETCAGCTELDQPLNRKSPSALRSSSSVACVCRCALIVPC